MGILNAVRAGLEEGAKRIKAYHGSPHDFDKFSTENIGTGEGLQNYGKGLYFAEREGTAEAYKTSGKTKGHMYEVNIDASPDELVDYDLPLNEQSKAVQEVVQEYKKGYENDLPLKERFGLPYEPTDEQVMQRALSTPYTIRQLKDRGIKGVKYDDPQTRFSPKGRTNNYVIFDDKTVEIARKYGVSMPVAGAILAGSLAPENAEAGVVSEGVHLAQRVLELGILKAQSAGNPTSVKTAITKYNKFMKESPAFADRERRAYAEDFKTIFNEADIAPKQIITPESLVGNTITPVRGDRSNIGQLSQVGGIPVDVPVEGGVKFSRQHGGWASSEGIARGQHNKHIAAANDTENDVYGVYNAMGVDSVNFSTPIAEGMMQQIPALNRLAKTDIKVFDKDLRNIKKVVTKKDGSRKVSYPYKDWVGLDHPDAMDQLMGQNGYPSVGALRTAFSTTMGKAAYRDKGFPTYGELVKAVEDKDLSNLNLGDAGHSFYKVDTSQGVQPFSQHKSYDTLMPGEYAGGLEQSIPFDVMFPKSFDRYTNSGKFLPRNQAIDAANKRKDGYEVADQQWLDGVKGFIERNKKLAAAGGVLASGGANANVPSAQSEDGLLKDTGDVLGEIMAGANRGVVDALNFFTVDQINAISQLMGSDKRVPTLYDVPLIEEATSGNFMDKGALRQAVRQGSEFLSPI
jgi:hypothetical protein